jgi:cell division protein ZapA
MKEETGKKSIKINIAKRDYPLTVNSDEVDAMHTAAKLVNDTLANFENTYSVSSVQDLLAMCALQLALKNVDKKNMHNDEEVEQTLKSIHSLLDEV